MIPYKHIQGNHRLSHFIEPDKDTKDYRKFSQSQRQRILNILQTRPFVPTNALKLMASQYNARIKELREEGHMIEPDTQQGLCGFKLKRGR